MGNASRKEKKNLQKKLSGGFDLLSHIVPSGDGQAFPNME